MRIQQTFLAIVLSVSFAFSGQAATPESAQEKGQKIAEEVDRRDEGFRDSQTETEMILRDESGRTSIRKMRVLTFEVVSNNAGDKTLVQFVNPRDITGTTLLSFSKYDGNDDQWLYLPALRRTKRISTASKSGPFLGSEFSFEDMLSQEHQRFTHKWLKDEACGKQTCFVVERRPKDKNSGYSRQIIWVDQKYYRPIRIELYDRKNTLLKVLKLEDYHKYKGRFWRAHSMIMQNMQTGKSTTLKTDAFKIGTGLREADFHPSRLRTIW